MTTADTRQMIMDVCIEFANFLGEKNEAYGNSVFNPIHIFAKGITPLQQIDVRIDDKLNRIKFGKEYAGDDTIKDLAGYFILREVAKRLTDCDKVDSKE